MIQAEPSSRKAMMEDRITRVGNPEKGGYNAGITLAAEAKAFYAPLIPIVMELHGKGLSLRANARELEKRKILPRWEYDFLIKAYDRQGRPRLRGFRSKGWNAAQVRRVVLRANQDRPKDTPAGP
jgi:hypothetical protein